MMMLMIVTSSPSMLLFQLVAMVIGCVLVYLSEALTNRLGSPSRQTTINECEPLLGHY